MADQNVKFYNLLHDGEPLKLRLHDNTGDDSQSPTVYAYIHQRPKFSFEAILNDVDIAVHAAPVTLISVSASNKNTALRFLQLFNKVAAPVLGDVPDITLSLPGGTPANPAIIKLGTEFWGEDGIPFSVGLSVGISTTAATFTPATVTDHIVGGIYLTE